MAATTLAVASVATAAYGAKKQTDAAKKAANQQTAAAQDSNQLNWNMFQQNRQDQEPFRQAGLAGMNEYLANLGLPQQQIQAQAPIPSGMSGVDPNAAAAAAYLKANPDVAASSFRSNPLAHFEQYGRAEGRAWGAPAQKPPTVAPTPAKTPAQTQQDAFAKFRSTPGYQFGLDEGTKAVQASAAARGGLNSGATLKALQRYGTNYADQQGYTPYMNRLASLAGMAQTSTNTTGAQGAQVAQNMGNNLINAGNARAQGTYDSANAWSNFGQQAIGALGQWAGNKYGGK